MAKSPKKSRRGGRRSPKKSNKGVKKIISKEVMEQPPSHAPEIHEAEDLQELSEQLPEAVISDKPDSVPSAKEMLTEFFASLNPDIHAIALSLSQLPEQEFIFGKLASMLAANGHFGDEVETNFAIVWKADEIWTRSLLAGEIKPPEPAPEEPEAVMEAEETPMEAEAPKEPEAAEDLEVDPAATAEITVNETKETEVVAPISEEPIVQEFTAVQEPVAEEPAVLEQPPMMEVIDKENATKILEDAVKMPIAKQFGEQQSPMHMSAMEGLAPKDVNVQPIDVQPMDLA